MSVFLSYTRLMMQHFVAFRDSPIIPLRRSPKMGRGGRKRWIALPPAERSGGQRKSNQPSRLSSLPSLLLRKLSVHPLALTKDWTSEDGGLEEIKVGFLSEVARGRYGGWRPLVRIWRMGIRLTSRVGRLLPLFRIIAP